jgi:hypothetical protein
MGEEAGAFFSVAAALELAVASGGCALTPEAGARPSRRSPACGCCATWPATLARYAARDGGWWPRKAGRVLASDHEALWYAVTHRLGSGHDFAATVTDLVLLLLVEAGDVAESTLVRRVGAGVVGEGWHERASGQPRRPSAPRWPRHCGCWRCSGCAALAGTGAPGGLRSPSQAARSPWRHCVPAPPVPGPTRAAHDLRNQRWRWPAGSAAPPAAAG